jgi:2-polyprenyl-6-methoxyphenol hydroxylase-like FAD-dependent oxidoreductase
MRERYDVIVVGARVGGSALAALLGVPGVSVLLLDRAQFPSTTSSTHFFRGAGMVGVLEGLGVLDAVLDLGCPPLTREFIYTGGEAEPAEGPPQNPGTIGYCLSVRREPLDFILLERARAEESVDFMERKKVSDVLWNGDRVVGVKLADGRSAHAEVVVGADGHNSVVASKVTPALEHESPPYRALYYRYVTGFLGPDASKPDALPSTAVSARGSLPQRTTAVFSAAARRATTHVCRGAGLGSRRRCRHASRSLERSRHRHGRCARHLPRRCDRRLAARIG